MRLLVLAILAMLVLPAFARDITGMFAQYSLKQREWLRQQVSPKTGAVCCNEADGDMVEEEIRNGEYWVRSDKTAGLWIRIPNEVIITGPNIFGRPVVWWNFTDGTPRPYCYSPGPLT